MERRLRLQKAVDKFHNRLPKKSSFPSAPTERGDTRQGVSFACGMRGVRFHGIPVLIIVVVVPFHKHAQQTDYKSGCPPE